MARLWMALWLPLALAGQVPDQQHHQHMESGVYARILDDPSRDAWQMPHQVVMALELKKDEVVADLGAGTGYFARRFARHAGQVLAVDIEKKLLDIATRDAPPNLRAIVSQPDDPLLQPGSVDTIFICDVWHHIDGRPAYLKKLAEALKPGGRIVMIDFHKRALPVGPPPSMKLSEQEVEAELAAAGFRVAKRHTFLPHQYFIEFRR